MWHAALFADVVMAGLRQAEFEVRSEIVWAKPTFVLGRSAYHWQHEPAWFAVRQGRAAPWYGGRAQSTVWEVPNLNAIGGSRTGANTPTGHATQKPVRVFEIPILNHTTAQDAVYDPFVGSGTTLMAGDKLGRPTYAMDVDPIYVEVARRRWEAFTGQTAVRLATGRAPARRRRRAASRATNPPSRGCVAMNASWTWPSSAAANARSPPTSGSRRAECPRLSGASSRDSWPP